MRCGGEGCDEEYTVTLSEATRPGQNHAVSARTQMLAQYLESEVHHGVLSGPLTMFPSIHTRNCGERGFMTNV